MSTYALIVAFHQYRSMTPYGSVGGWLTIIAYRYGGRGMQWGLLRHYANNKSGKGALEEERG